MIPPPRQESGQARPAAPSGYLMAALLLVVLAPLALAGWLAGAAAIRSGWVSRRRLAAAATVTGALAFLLIGPPWPLAASCQP